MLRRSATFFVFGFGLAFSARAQSTRHDAPRALDVRQEVSADAFGGEIQQTVIGVSDFMPDRSGYSYQTDSNSHLGPTAPGTQVWFAPLHLPSGASIEEIRVLVQDDDDAQDIVARLSGLARAVDGSADCDFAFFFAQWNESSVGLDGFGTIVLQGNEPWVVRTQEPNTVIPCGSPNNYVWYSLWIQLLSVDQNISGAVVRWRRSISPAPAVATFNDVPSGHPQFQFVEALAAAGITAGCGGGNFCPDNSLTRGQMAVFLAKALGLHWPL